MVFAAVGYEPKMNIVNNTNKFKVKKKISESSTVRDHIEYMLT